MGVFTIDDYNNASKREPDRVKLTTPVRDMDEVLVKKLSVSDREKIELAVKNPDISDTHGQALYVALSLVKEDGKPALSVQDARSIDTDELNVLFAAASSVNVPSEGNV